MQRSTIVQSAILEGYAVLFKGLNGAGTKEKALDEILVGYVSTLQDVWDHTEPIRIKAAEVLLILTRLAVNGGRLHDSLNDVVAQASNPREVAYGAEFTPASYSSIKPVSLGNACLSLGVRATVTLELS